VTSVGATINVSPEVVVDFSGGGFSNYFPRPAWQNPIVGSYLETLPSNFSGVFNRSGRGYPDVSLVQSVAPRHRTKRTLLRRSRHRDGTLSTMSLTTLNSLAGRPHPRRRSPASLPSSMTALARSAARRWASSTVRFHSAALDCDAPADV
jgi:hypothetical protein